MIEIVISSVCRFFGISKAVFHSSTRKEEVVKARQIAMQIIRNITGDTFEYIGKKVGGKTKATVIHAIKVVNDLYSVDKKFKLDYDLIEIDVKQRIHDKKYLYCFNRQFNIFGFKVLIKFVIDNKISV